MLLCCKWNTRFENSVLMQTFTCSSLPQVLDNKSMINWCSVKLLKRNFLSCSVTCVRPGTWQSSQIFSTLAAGLWVRMVDVNHSIFTLLFIFVARLESFSYILTPSNGDDDLEENVLTLQLWWKVYLSLFLKTLKSAAFQKFLDDDSLIQSLLLVLSQHHHDYGENNNFYNLI